MLVTVTNIDVDKSVSFLSSIAWIIKMERIHYERQQKLEAIATDMYKNSVLVSPRFFLHKIFENLVPARDSLEPKDLVRRAQRAKVSGSLIFFCFRQLMSRTN